MRSQKYIVIVLTIFMAIALVGCKSNKDNKHASELNKPAGSGDLAGVWSADLKMTVGVEPVVSGNTVAVISKEGKVVGLDKNTGKQLWVYEDAAAPAHEYSLSSDETQVLFGVKGADYVSLDPATGKQKWKTHLGVDADRLARITDGKIYLGSSVIHGPAKRASLYILDQKTGKKLSEIETGHVLFNTPAVFDGLIYISGVYPRPFTKDEGGPHRVTAYDPAQNFKEVWVYDSDDGSTKSLIAENGVVNYIGYQDYVTGLDAKTGEKKFRKYTGNWVQGLTYHDKRIYFAPSNNKIFAINQMTGETIWFYALDYDRVLSYIIGRPQIKDGKVYWLHRDTRDFAVQNAADGQLLWKAKTELHEDTRTMPVFDGNRVYLSGLDGKIFAYDMK